MFFFQSKISPEKYTRPYTKIYIKNQHLISYKMVYRALLFSFISDEIPNSQINIPACRRCGTLSCCPCTLSAWQWTQSSVWPRSLPLHSCVSCGRRSWHSSCWRWGVGHCCGSGHLSFWYGSFERGSRRQRARSRWRSICQSRLDQLPH